MGTTLIDNFDYKGRNFLDTRQSVATLAALRGMDAETMPDGFMAYCAETGRWYIYNQANDEDAETGRWRACPPETVVLSEDKFEALAESGKLDARVTYMTYEDE